jgi:hypothetical protein
MAPSGSTNTIRRKFGFNQVPQSAKDLFRMESPFSRFNEHLFKPCGDTGLFNRLRNSADVKTAAAPEFDPTLRAKSSICCACRVWWML